MSEAELPADERERLTALAGQFSREDLMRAFDLLSTAEQDIRTVSHPRYYFEMVLLRWMHLRKLVPLTDLLEQLGSGGARTAAPTGSRVAPAGSKSAPAGHRVAPTSSKPAAASDKLASTSGKLPATSDRLAPAGDRVVAPAGALKDSLLAEIRSGKAFFYNTVVAQAQKIDVVDDRVTFTFLPAHRALREQFEQSRPWLEAAAERLTGRKIVVAAVQATSEGDQTSESRPAGAATAAAPKRDLKAEALSSTGVQALLDVFPAEIRDVEEM
jgi:DNA polymerase III gamma/tau subunit